MYFRFGLNAKIVNQVTQCELRPSTQVYNIFKVCLLFQAVKSVNVSNVFIKPSRNQGFCFWIIQYSIRLVIIHYIRLLYIASSGIISLRGKDLNMKKCFLVFLFLEICHTFVADFLKFFFISIFIPVDSDSNGARVDLDPDYYEDQYEKLHKNR